MRVLWRACNPTSFSPCLTGPVDYPFASRHKGPGFKSPGGYLCETGILLLALSRYIGDPNMIDHCGLVWGGPRSEPSQGLRAENVIIPLDLTQLSCPGFTLAAGLASGFTTDGVGCWGGALWRACNPTSFSPCLTGTVDYPFASRHKGPGFKSPGGYLCETGILLLALSRYIGDPDVIDYCGLVWGGSRSKPSLGLRAENVIIPLDLTQLSCPGFTLAAGLPSGFTTDGVGCWGGEPCGEPAIPLHSHHVSLVQWTTRLLPIARDPGSNPLGGTYMKPGFYPG